MMGNLPWKIIHQFTYLKAPQWEENAQKPHKKGKACVYTVIDKRGQIQGLTRSGKWQKRGKQNKAENEARLANIDTKQATGYEQGSNNYDSGRSVLEGKQPKNTDYLAEIFWE